LVSICGMGRRVIIMFRIHEYDTSYPILFQKESQKLAEILKGTCLIEHIGSTAIPGVDGKGVIDIMLVFDKPDEIEPIIVSLQQHGYYFTDGGVDRRDKAFMSSSGERESGPGDIHLHLVSIDNQDYPRAILFRDYLIRHPKAKQSYVNLKYELYKKVAGNRSEYTKLKSSFIEKIIALAQDETTRIE